MPAARANVKWPFSWLSYYHNVYPNVHGQHLSSGTKLKCLFLKLLLRVPDDVNVFEWHPSIAGTIIGGCMNGQIVIWDITEYVSKFKRNKCVWKHSVVMSKHAKKLHVEDGFIPILYWSAESNVQVSHQSPVEDMKWLPKNVWVNLLRLFYI